MWQTTFLQGMAEILRGEALMNRATDLATKPGATSPGSLSSQLPRTICNVQNILAGLLFPAKRLDTVAPWGRSKYIEFVRTCVVNISRAEQGVVWITHPSWLPGTHALDGRQGTWGVYWSRPIMRSRFSSPKSNCFSRNMSIRQLRGSISVRCQACDGE